MSQQTYYGFCDDGCGWPVEEIFINTSRRHGIKRGYDSTYYKKPCISKVYYYVEVEQTNLVVSDTELHVRYEEIAPKLKKWLEKIWNQCVYLNHEVSDLGMMYCVGSEYVYIPTQKVKDAMMPKHESVDVKYESDGDSSACGFTSEEESCCDDVTPGVSGLNKSMCIFLN